MDKTTEALNEWLKLDDFDKSVIISSNLGFHQIELEDILKYKSNIKTISNNPTIQKMLSKILS
jgi:hypothetical protein